MKFKPDLPAEHMDRPKEIIDLESKQLSIRLLKAISTFEDAYDTNAPTLNGLRVLLYIYSKEACHKQDIEKDLNIQYATSSRILGQLDKDCGFIERYADPENYRKTKCRVTEKGIQLVQAIAKP